MAGNVEQLAIFDDFFDMENFFDDDMINLEVELHSQSDIHDNKGEETVNEQVTETNEQTTETTDDKTNKNVSNRFKNVDVNAFLAEKVNKNTMKKTENDMKVVYEFLQLQNEHRYLQFIPPEQLNAYICQFLVSVTRKNGEEYEPTSLRSFVSSIDMQLRSSG